MSGVNPAIVVNSARENLPAVTKKLIFPLLMNAGQDCMTSDVVFAQNGISKKLVTEILKEFEKNAQKITPITMTKDLQKLKDYRAKYAKYLVNADAKIDDENKIVTPHVFVFPYSEFASLDIREHFAPFISIVTFKNFDELEAAARDPRIQRKAMYAIVYGGHKMSADLDRAQEIFRQNQHTVVINQHLYENWDMNSPFGGSGVDSSLSALIQLRADGTLEMHKKNRPMLISKEVEEVFRANPVTVHNLPNRENLPQLAIAVPTGTVTIKPLKLEEIQRFAKKEGLATTVPWPIENEDAIKKLYGITLIEDIKTGRHKELPGVVLHRTDVDQKSGTSKIRGVLNPLLSQKKLLEKFESKYAEWQFVNSVDPELMPGMVQLESIIKANEFQAYDANRAKIQASIIAYQRSPSVTLLKEIERLFINFLNPIFKNAKEKYPRGAVIKNYGEYASGDLGTSVTTSSSVSQIAIDYVLTLASAKGNTNKIKFRDTANGARFLHRLIYESSQILIQERLDIAQTDFGLPMEFRVDFIHGQPVGCRQRYGFEFYPHECEKAKAIIAKIMSNAPFQYRHFSGGADVAQTKEGKWVIFEFNFGASSGTLAPEFYPFYANEIFSLLKGNDTWLLKFAKKLAKKPVVDQRSFIVSQKNTKPIWWMESVEDISQFEWAHWLRNYHLQEWMNNGCSLLDLMPLQQKLTELLGGLEIGRTEDFKRLMDSANMFMQRAAEDPQICLQAQSS